MATEAALASEVRPGVTLPGSTGRTAMSHRHSRVLGSTFDPPAGGRPR